MSISATQGSNSVINTIENQIQYIENNIGKIKNKQELSKQIENTQEKLDDVLFYEKQIDINEITKCQQRLDRIKNIFEHGAAAPASQPPSAPVPAPHSQSFPQRSFNHVAPSPLPTTPSPQQPAPSPQPSTMNQGFRSTLPQQPQAAPISVDVSQLLSRLCIQPQPPAQQPTATPTTPPVFSAFTPPVQSNVQPQRASTPSPQEVLTQNQSFLELLKQKDPISYYWVWLHHFPVERYNAVTKTGSYFMTKEEQRKFETGYNALFQDKLQGKFNFATSFQPLLIKMLDQAKNSLSSDSLMKNPVFLELFKLYDSPSCEMAIQTFQTMASLSSRAASLQPQPPAQQPTATPTTPPVFSAFTPPVQSNVQPQRASTPSPQEVLTQNQSFLEVFKQKDPISYYWVWLHHFTVDCYNGATKTGSYFMTKEQQRKFETEYNGLYKLQDKFSLVTNIQPLLSIMFDQAKNPSPDGNNLIQNPVFLELLKLYDPSSYEMTVRNFQPPARSSMPPQRTFQATASLPSYPASLQQQLPVQRPTTTPTTTQVSTAFAPPVQSSLQPQRAPTLSPQEVLKKNLDFLTILELMDRTSYYCTWFTHYSVEQFTAITQTGTLLMTESEKKQFQTLCDARFQASLSGKFNFREQFKKYFAELQEQEREALSPVKRTPNEIALKHGILTKNPIFLKLLEIYDVFAYSQVIYKTKFPTL